MDYIDRDTAIRTAIEMCVKVVGHGITQIDAVNIANEFENIPTADVVPKSEVEKEIENWQELYADTVSRWEKAYEELEIKLENAKAKVAREIFEEIYKTMNSIYSRVQHDCVGRHGDDPHTIMLVGKLEGIKRLGDEIAELKKKYTEEGK